MSLLHVLSAFAGNQPSVEIAHVEELENSRPAVIQVCGRAETGQSCEPDHIRQHVDEHDELDQELEHLNVHEVLRQPLVRKHHG